MKRPDFLRASVPGPKRKYRNTKTILNGELFDSIGEMRRYVDLSRLQDAGEITGLRRQVSFILCPPVRLVGEQRASAIRYVADFVYERDGKTITEDFKGFDTKESRLKRRLMKHLLGIDVVLSGPAAKRAA